MQYTKLGNADLTVSRVCMGCMGFGDAQNGQHSWTIDEEHSREIIKRGLELGINFFDTANAYTDSEEKIGMALADVRRNLFIATKTGSSTPDEFWKHLELSLTRMKTDYIDIYQFHNPAFCPKSRQDALGRNDVLHD